MKGKMKPKMRWQEMPGEHPRMNHPVPMSSMDMMMPDMEPKKPRSKKRKKK